MEHIQERTRLWLAEHGFEGKVISQRLYEDRYVVVLNSGHKVSIPLATLPELPTPEPPTRKSTIQAAANAKAQAATQ